MSRTLELTDFTSTPVDIKTFIEDPQYLGEFAKGIYPYWKEKLQEVKMPALTVVTKDLKLNLIALYALGMIMAFLRGYYCRMT